VQEINRASSQVMAAVEEIRKSAQVQASATEESAAAIAQIEKGLEVALQRAQAAGEKVKSISALISNNKQSVVSLIGGVADSVTSSRSSLKQIKDLELVSRRIDKIVDAITTVSIQTNMLAVNGSIEAARAGEFGKVSSSSPPISAISRMIPPRTPTASRIW
jgi:methyl-accepting chemotaxis protein